MTTEILIYITMKRATKNRQTRRFSKASEQKRDRCERKKNEYRWTKSVPSNNGNRFNMNRSMNAIPIRKSFCPVSCALFAAFDVETEIMSHETQSERVLK